VGNSAAFTPSPMIIIRKMPISSGCSEGSSPDSTPPRGELGVADQRVQRDDAEQQQGTTAERVVEVDLARAQGLAGAPVHHQRIRGERQQFVEQQEGEQVAGQRDADGAGDAEAEEAEEAAAVGRLLEIADGIDGREQPEQRGQPDEHHAQRIGAQDEVSRRR
jgi:hypothetical protein